MVQGVLHDPQCSIFSKAINDFYNAPMSSFIGHAKRSAVACANWPIKRWILNIPHVHKHVIPWELWYYRMCWSFEICSTNSIAACQQGGHGISLEACKGIMVLSAEDGVGVTPRNFSTNSSFPRRLYRQSLSKLCEL